MAQKRRKKKRSKKLRTQRRIILSLVLVIFVLAGIIAISGSGIKRPNADKPVQTDQPTGTVEETDPRKEGFYTVLLCGTDDGNGGTDTIMLLAMDTENNRANLVSFPRDTLVNEDWTVKKINSAYNRGGIESVRKQVNKIVGFPVDYYVTVDLQAFIEVIDAIGGVEFNVSINMNYDDPLQNLHIHFKAGMQKLDGQAAMEVMRFRKNNNGGGYPMQDLGRIETQQAFLKAVAEKLLSPASIGKIPEYIRIFSDHVDSDLSLGEMIWLGNAGMKIGLENMTFSTLPGAASTYRGASYYILDPAACLELINAGLNPYQAPRTAADLDIKTA